MSIGKDMEILYYRVWLWIIYVELKLNIFLKVALVSL